MRRQVNEDTGWGWGVPDTWAAGMGGEKQHNVHLLLCAHPSRLKA